MKCIVCGKDLTGRQTKYCSKECKCKDYYSKHKNTAYSQKKDYHGAILKYKLVPDRGGKCERCGYDKNLAALEFHHMDPQLKLFTLNARNIERRSDEEVLEEYKKCELLCSNCHAELHHPEMDISNIDTLRNSCLGIIRRKEHELNNLGAY